MEFALLGWPTDGPTLDLDHREFSYAGKFVMSNTGKAVAREPAKAEDETEEGDPNERRDETEEGDEEGDEGGLLLAAAAFNEDRTDAGVCWIRYVTVRADRRGEGIGPRLVAFVVDRLAGRDYERARIAVNNPFAYQALYRGGFHFTGEETGVAELVLDRSIDGEETVDRSHDGVDRSHDGDETVDRSRETYQAGLDVFRERDLSAAEERFLDEKRGANPPAVRGPPG